MGGRAKTAIAFRRLCRRFDVVHVLGKDLFFVRDNVNCGVFSARTKRWVVPVDFNNIGPLLGSKVLYCVRNGGKVGVFSTKTHCLVVPVWYTDVWRLTDTLVRVKKGRKYGIYHVSSKRLVLPLKFTHIDLLHHAKFSYLINEDGKRLGVFSTRTRRVVVPVEFSGIMYLTDKTFWVHMANGARGLFDTRAGKIVWPER